MMRRQASRAHYDIEQAKATNNGGHTRDDMMQIVRGGLDMTDDDHQVPWMLSCRPRFLIIRVHVS